VPERLPAAQIDDSRPARDAGEPKGP